VSVEDEAGDFIVFIGNDDLVQELFQRNVSERDPRRDHLLRALGRDPGQAVARARWRGFGQEIA
jgi:hypothetical protein